jgi:hypothetical protein
MVAEETSSENAFETTLTAPMGPTDLIAAVVTKGTLTSPALIVIEPDDDLQREIIRFNGTFGGSTFVTQNVTFRYLPGSAAPSGLTHPSGAIVRSTPTAQHIEDIHDRIDAHDTKAAHDALNIDADTLDGLDSAAFLEKSGGTMVGKITLDADPTAALHAATKQYADAFIDQTEGDLRYVQVDGDTMTGLIILSGPPAADLGAVNKLFAEGLITTHEGAGNPHAVYLTQAEADALYLALTGTADAALKWQTARTITLGGDLTGAVVIDGSANVVLTAVVLNDSHTHDSRYFTEGESDSRFVNKTGDTMTGALTIQSNARIEHQSSQVQISNLSVGGKTLLIGTTAIAPQDTGSTDLGSSGFRWNHVFADLAVGGSVPDTVRYRTSDGQLFDGASTRKLKNNIRPLEGSERIYDLEPVSFDWKSDGGAAVGLIAEDTFPIFPEVVSLDIDGEPKGIAYDWLIAPLLAEVQKLAARVAELEAR